MPSPAAAAAGAGAAAQRGGGGGGGGGGSQAVPRRHPPAGFTAVLVGHSIQRLLRRYTGPTTAATIRYSSPFYFFLAATASALDSALAWATARSTPPTTRAGSRTSRSPTRIRTTAATATGPRSRLEVKPHHTHLYINGYPVVVSVDSFDGVFQRLDLPTGQPKEIVAYMKGYRTYRQRTLFRPGESYHFKGILEPLPAGAPEEPAPQPSANSRPDPYQNQNPNRDPRDPYYRDPAGQDPNRQAPPPDDRGRTMPLPEHPDDLRPPDSRGFGTLNIRVQPGDADVIIDGERWDSPEGGSRLASSCRRARIASKCGRTASSRTRPPCRSVPATRRP